MSNITIDQAKTNLNVCERYASVYNMLSEVDKAYQS